MAVLVFSGLIAFVPMQVIPIAGVVTGALTWLLPLSWEWQGTLFAVLTLLAAWLWSKWLRKRV
ncbi:NfeD family protein, partial [Klebsiella pneumoniae]|uniref:NfeD family protein n=1 Tax=Klebsiella pneumoniae TaxID=573 RepID=UPI0035B628E0